MNCLPNPAPNPPRKLRLDSGLNGARATGGPARPLNPPRSLLVILVLMLFCLLTRIHGSAHAEVKTPTAFASTNLIITSTNGSDFTTTTWISRGDVRVLDAQLYMECDLLTVLLQTNTPPATNGPGATPRQRPAAADGGLTNVDARIDRIIAETNVLIMTKDATLIGDRAVYTQSNDLVVVTGTLVIAETDRSYTFGTHFEFDLKTSQGSIVGPHVMELKVDSSPGNTNSTIRPGSGMDRRLHPGSKPRETPQHK